MNNITEKSWQECESIVADMFHHADINDPETYRILEACFSTLGFVAMIDTCGQFLQKRMTREQIETEYKEGLQKIDVMMEELTEMFNFSAANARKLTQEKSEQKYAH